MSAATAGGRGTIVGTLLAVLLVGVLTNGMNLLGVGAFYQRVALGILLVGFGRSWIPVGLAHIAGFASLVAVAALARLMRAQPWRQREGRVRQPHGYAAPALAPGL